MSWGFVQNVHICAVDVGRPSTHTDLAQWKWWTPIMRPVGVPVSVVRGAVLAYSPMCEDRAMRKPIFDRQFAMILAAALLTFLGFTGASIGIHELRDGADKSAVVAPVRSTPSPIYHVAPMPDRPGVLRVTWRLPIAVPGGTITLVGEHRIDLSDPTLLDGEDISVGVSER